MMNEKEYSKIIARNLRRLMYEKQKTQAEVSRELGISKATLSSWMNGTRQPKIENIDMLCEYFGVPRSAIMEPDGVTRSTPITEEQAELVRVALTSDAEAVHFALELLKRMQT